MVARIRFLTDGVLGVADVPRAAVSVDGTAKAQGGGRTDECGESDEVVHCMRMNECNEDERVKVLWPLCVDGGRYLCCCQGFAGDSPHMMVPGRENPMVVNLETRPWPDAEVVGKIAGDYLFRKGRQQPATASEKVVGLYRISPLILRNLDHFHQFNWSVFLNSGLDFVKSVFRLRSLKMQMHLPPNSLVN